MVDGAERVAVTGAGGFIGEAVSRRLADEGASVVGVDAAEAAREPVEAAGASFVRCDVTDAAALAGAFDGVAGVVHCAAIVAESGDMATFVRVNVEGTRNVIDAAADARVVCLASVAVWGYDFRFELSEGSPPRPCGNPYVDTKGAAETLALLRGATVVRPGDVYGPRSVPWVLRPLETMRRGLFRLPGAGEGLITPVYVDDLVDGIVLALRAPEAGGRAYTLWDGRAVTAAEFFSYHARWLGRDRVPTAPRPLLLAGAAVQELVDRARGRPPSISREALRFVSRRALYPNARARRELGWEPRVSLEEGMRRTGDRLRAEGLV